MTQVQSDIGRQGAILIIGGAVLVAALGYVLYSYSGKTAPDQSAIGSVQGKNASAIAETERYAEVLNKYNQEHAATAAQAGQTYLSVFSLRPQPVAAAAPETPAPAVAPTNSPAPPAASLPQPDHTADQRRRERADEQAQGLVGNWMAAAHATARVGDMELAAAARPAEPANAGNAATAPPSVLIPAFTLAPAILGTDIDTDENSMVEAFLPSGPYAGATVHAMGYRRLSNTVDIEFTFMRWKSHTYRIHARSVDKTSLRSGLSGEVNNRYWSRVLVPALAGGLGRAGQLFEQSDTQNIITPLGGVVQSRPGSVSGRAVAGTIVGGVAGESARVLQSDAAQLPVKQVLIARSETIGVRFIEPVLSSDDVTASHTGSEGASASLSAPPTSAVAPPYRSDIPYPAATPANPAAFPVFNTPLSNRSAP